MMKSLWDFPPRDRIELLIVNRNGLAVYPLVEPSRCAADLTVVWWALADHHSGWLSIF
jgi:hypothetical protein